MMAIYFKAKEFACKCGCGLSALDPKLIDILDEGRKKYGRPIIITSGSRCQAHNQAIGGARRSAHLIGPDGYSHAVDILVETDRLRYELFFIFYELGIRRFEVSNLHLHIDNADYLPHPILAATFFKGKDPY
ncbi:MAG: D-Ala-D-Ala carboxypeptidase family metallohydrolase [Bacilli bacterium]|jgi:hypothetical protein